MSKKWTMYKPTLFNFLGNEKYPEIYILPSKSKSRTVVQRLIWPIFLGSVPRKSNRGPFLKTKPEVSWFLVSWLISPCTPWNQETCQHGFMVSWLIYIGGQRETYVGFMVSCTQSLGHRNDDRFHGFVDFISWHWNDDRFHGFVHSISGTSRWR